MLLIKKLLYFIPNFMFCILLFFSLVFMLISYNEISLDFISVIIDVLIIVIIPIFIILIYKKILNFKGAAYIDNSKQIISRYIYLFFVYFYTKCALEIFDLQSITFNNAIFISVWMNFLFVGYWFFLYYKKKSYILNKPVNTSIIEKIKLFVVKNKDAENSYSFVLKYIPFLMYNIISLYYLTRISNDVSLILTKMSVNTDVSTIQVILILFFGNIPHNLINFIQMALPISMMIYGSILMIASFFHETKVSFERKLYRIFGLILGIILLSAISYTYLFIVDSNSFMDLRINFEISFLSILKVFLNLFYFSLATFTTTGYGDITATTQTAKNMVLIQMFFQIVTITISLGMFFNWKNQEEVKVNRYESRFSIAVLKIWYLFSMPVIYIICKILRRKRISQYITNLVSFINILIFEVIFFGFLYFLLDQFFFVKGDQRSFWDFLYFSTTTVSTIGFGDIYPIRLFTKLLVSSQMLINMILVLFGINIINSNGKSNGIVCKARVRKKFEGGSGELELENRKHINVPKNLLPQDAIIGDIVEIKIEKKMD